MFSPNNQEIEMLKIEIAKINDDIKQIDIEYNEIEHIKNYIQELKNSISEINSKISSLTKQRKDICREIFMLKKKIDGKSLNEVCEIKDSLYKKIENKKAIIQNLIDTEFKFFINTMTEENTLSYHLFSYTKTTPIMDNFYNDKQKDFLVFRGVFYNKDLVIIRGQNNVSAKDVPSLTMTELKTYNSKHCTPERMYPLLEEIKKYNNSKLKHGQRVQFDKPIPLGGQTYANQTGYGSIWNWSYGIGSCIEGTYYGEVTKFLIIGFIYKGR